MTTDVVGSTPVTAGNRTGTFGISANAIDALLFGGAGAAAAPGIFSVAGVFSDPQFQLVVRALNQQKGVDLLSAPRVTTKSGQKATIEIIREFIYPTQFQPPQIPQTVGSTGGTNGTTGGSTPSIPVTPTTPTGFEKRNTGVTLEVEPVIGPDNFTYRPQPPAAGGRVRRVHQLRQPDLVELDEHPGHHEFQTSSPPT